MAAPASRGASSRPIEFPVPTKKIWVQTWTNVFPNGIVLPSKAFAMLTGWYLRWRKYQIMAATIPPTKTDKNRRPGPALMSTGTRLLSRKWRKTCSVKSSSTLRRSELVPTIVPKMIVVTASPQPLFFSSIPLITTFLSIAYHFIMLRQNPKPFRRATGEIW